MLYDHEVDTTRAWELIIAICNNLDDSPKYNVEQKMPDKKCTLWNFPFIYKVQKIEVIYGARTQDNGYLCGKYWA